ncbi:MAG: hypothetical protein GXP59_09850 [Deltaproteobacteria bacterium]|nr:hypothetical protein [Deltaproteobacteria bacterium]
MLSQCPHCQKDLNFDEEQKQKIRAALSGLKTGTLKLGCPFCKQAILLRADGSAAPEKAAVPEQDVAGTVKPPAYPDISWMANDICDTQAVLEDVPKVLILMAEGAARDAVAQAFVELGYQTSFPESAGDAVEQMRFVNFAAVVLHSPFDGGFADSKFHHYMSRMPMTRRRGTYYVLVGPEFHTLYDLEAMAYSANIVVNDAEVRYFPTILKKGRQDHDELFGPYITARAAN